ncbi:MAG: hypothetical protein NTZ72_05795 [Afipia sp.]|jgi:hypothetical protein|nr:hypothetical protein [Afipia sp.]
MTSWRFTKFTALTGALLGVVLSGASSAFAAKPKPLNAGEILSGELTAMKSKKTKGLTFQLTSEPRRLPAPSGLCNLETGPETFQIVTNSAAEAAELKPFIGKTVSVKANEMSCPQDAQQFSDAIVTKWSLVGK